MYRTPTDPPEQNKEFYQYEYQQGFTTSLPDDEELGELVTTGFSNHEKSYASILDVFESLQLENSAKVFDYGCSWGYGSWQIAKKGYDVYSYEISKPRARFAAERLKIKCSSEIADYEAKEFFSQFDAVFSNHVVEHLPQPSSIIELAHRLLKPGGYLIAITPNGSLKYRDSHSESWHRSWGEVHPNLIDEEFWKTQLEDMHYIICGLSSAPAYIADWLNTPGCVVKGLTEPELICISRKR